MTTINAADGQTWKVYPDPDQGGWAAAVRCSCAFGHHWHDQQWFPYKAEALAYVEALRPLTDLDKGR